MTQAHRRDDLSDKIWALLEPHLPGQAEQWGGVAHDNRRFLNTVFWILRTQTPWHNLAPDYGDKAVWENLLERLIDEPDYEWLMIDATHCKVYPHAAGARRSNQSMRRTKRGLNTKVHLNADRGYDSDAVV